ncbi:hypothetical protein ACFPRL_24795 [Pseudoclavibacter helvolus]
MAEPVRDRTQHRQRTWCAERHLPRQEQLDARDHLPGLVRGLQLRLDGVRLGVAHVPSVGAFA